jgi:hypothetical protein
MKKAIILFYLVSSSILSFSQISDIFLFKELKKIELPAEWGKSGPGIGYWSLVLNEHKIMFETIICHSVNECIDVSLKSPFYILGQRIYEDEQYLYFTYAIHDFPAYDKTYLVFYDKMNGRRINQLLIRACIYGKINISSKINEDYSIETKTKKVIYDEDRYKIIEKIEEYKLQLNNGRIERSKKGSEKIYFLEKIYDCDF